MTPPRHGTPAPAVDAPFPLPDARTPVLTTLRVVALVAMAGFTVGATLYMLREHVADPIRHLDASAVQTRGGPVYRQDLRDSEDRLLERVRTEGEATRAAIQSARPLRMVCRRGAEGTLECGSP